MNNKRYINGNNLGSQPNKVENWNEPSFYPQQHQQHQTKACKNYSSKNQRHHHSRPFYQKVNEEISLEQNLHKIDEQIATVPINCNNYESNEQGLNEIERIESYEVRNDNLEIICDKQQQNQCIPQEQNVTDMNCSTGVYDYDYNQPQYYVYHPYAEYPANGNPVIGLHNASPVPSTNINTAALPQQQQQPSYYTYQTIPSYIYDPNMTFSHYSPGQQIQQQQTVLSSPQHQSTILASYHTPPQPQHQLYLTPSSLSSNEQNSNTSSITIANERPSTCNSPQVSTMPLSQIAQTPVASSLIQNMANPANSISPNSYLYYSNTNPYLTPQPYQSPMQQTHPYMMYQTPTVYQTIPTNPSTPVMSQNNYSTSYNKSTNYRSKKYNKKNFTNKFNSLDQSPMVSIATRLSYSPAESAYGSGPVTPQQAMCCNEEVNNEEGFVLDQQTLPLYPTLPYGDPMIPLSAYDFENDYETYGDEYADDDNGNNLNGDDEEQLACKICRGRRMCFCYFLKVRYYKFPSFFDLVDHQYKKWRSTMAKAKKA